jgi:predicted nucleic acid-binding protein
MPSGSVSDLHSADVAAIRLRREYQLKVPDAIVAATALSLEAPLLTNDIKLLRIPGLSSQELELK